MERSTAILRRCVWIYFWLLIFEGALRKWVTPSLAAPLLIIRDPVVLATCAYALYARRFPMHWIMVWTGILGILLLLGGLVQLVISSESNVLVCLFGLRANFLHLPMLVIMGTTLTRDDVLRFGKWILILALPMSALMTLQFLAPPTSWLNAGADPDVAQLAASMGRIRPAGTFSFISGPIFFFSIVAAFLIFSQLERRAFSWLPILLSGMALFVGLGVSGSRTAVANVAIVSLALSICWFFHPSTFLRSLRLIVLVLLIVAAVWFLPFFREGLSVFQMRILEASDFEGGSRGFIQRFLTDMTDPVRNLPDLPLLGYGLGVGTNAGAALLFGRRDFLLAEEEYGRVLMESGPILGGAYLVFRFAVAIWLGWHGLRALRQKNFLPLLLWAAVAVNLIRGQWGQPTIAGFAIFIGGLCMAACRISQPWPDEENVDGDQPSIEP